MANFKCFQCSQEIVFDAEHIGKNGKKIPLDPTTKQPHDCPMREKNPFKPNSDVQLQPGEDWKNDHGNEETPGQGRTTIEEKIKLSGEYVDHTLKGQSKVKIFIAEYQPEIETEYNAFLAQNNGKIKTQGAQSHILAVEDRIMYSIFLYYEETK